MAIAKKKSRPSRESPGRREKRKPLPAQLLVADGGKILAANAAISGLIGRDAADMVGHDLLEFVHPADRRLLQYVIRRAIRAPEDAPMRLLTSGGTSPAVHLWARKRLRRGQEVVLIVATDLVQSDLDSEKILRLSRHGWVPVDARQELEESRQQFEDLYDTTPVGYLTTDDRGIILSANLAAAHFLGLEKPNIIARPLLAFVARDSRRQLLAHLGRLRKGQSQVVSEVMLAPPGREQDLPVQLVSNPTSHSGVTLPRFLTAIVDLTERKVVEAKLGEREEQLRAALEAADMGEWELDLRTQTLRRSSRHLEIFGYSERGREWTLDSFLGHVVPEDRNVVTGTLELALKTRRPWEFECRIVRADRVQRWIWVRGRLEYTAGGKPARFRGLIRDTTAGKEAEEALRLTRERERARSAELERVLDAVPAAVWISHDPRGEYITGNRLSNEWLHLPPGANVSKSAPEGERPETFTMVKDGVEIPPEQMPVQQSSAGTEIRDYEFDFVYPDATVRHVVGNATPLFDSEGKPRGSVSAFIDLTERKRAERDLRATRDYLEALFNYANAPIIVWDTEFRITGFNKAFELLTGRKTEDVIGQSLDILFPDEMREQAHALLRRTQQGERWETVVIPILRLDGSVRTVVWNSATLYGEDETTVTATIAQGQDVTERRQAEKEREDYLVDLSFIAETATAFLRKQTSTEVFEYCAQKISEHVESGMVVVTEYEGTEGSRAVRAVSGDPEAIRAISQALGKELRFLRLPLDARTGERMVPGRLVRIEGGMCAFASDDLPLSVCRQAESRLGLSDIYAIPFVWEAEVLGTLVVLSRNDLTARTGRVIETLVSQAAITLKRIRAEESLQQREKDFRKLMEDASDGIVLVDPKGRIAAVNSRACELYGYSPGELISRSVRELIPSEDAALLSGFGAELKSGNPVLVEHRVLRKDGSIVYVETSARRLADGRYQAIIRDITERKDAEREFTQAVQSEVFDRLIASLRQFRHGEGLGMNLHRLALFGKNYQAIVSEAREGGDGSATPPDAYALSRLQIAAKEFLTIGYPRLREIASLVRAVQGDINQNAAVGDEPVFATDLFRRSEILRADVEELIRTARGEGDGELAAGGDVGMRVFGQIQNIFRNIEVLTSKLNQHFTSGVSEIVRTVVAALQPVAAGHVMEIREETPEIKAIISPTDLGEVLSILLTNSVEALAGKAPGEGRITVRLGARGARARIEVEDNGAGIPEEIRSRVLTGGETTKGEGRGFGLRYAQRLLRKYGGTLSYDERYTGGALFAFELVLA